MRAMRGELVNEMERCRQLFDAVIATSEGTNDHDDAALDSDGARETFRDLCYDYIAFARQMAVDAMPGDPLRFAASSLRRVRREWNSMRFFDRDTYQEGFPSQNDILNALQNDVGNRKRPVNQYSWNSIPTCLLYTSPSPRDGLLSRMPSSA